MNERKIYIWQYKKLPNQTLHVHRASSHMPTLQTDTESSGCNSLCVCACVCVCVCVHACVCACMLACLHVCVLQNEIAAVMNRMFHYTGQFVPVKWKCRAKLPSGKLCERMDRIKVRMMAILTLKTILSAFNSEWTIQAILMIQTIPSAFNSEWTLSTHSKAGQ